MLLARALRAVGVSVLLGGIALGIGSWSCSSPVDNVDAIAEVGERSIIRSDFQRHLELITGQSWPSVADPVASRILDDYLDLEAVAGDNGFGLPVDPSERSRALRELTQARCGAAVPEPEILAEPLLNAGSTRPRLRMRQLLVDDLDTAELARQRVVEGESFEAVSAEVSRAPNAEAGGDLGTVELEALPEIFVSAIAELEEGELSQPVQGSVGVHVFQILERENVESQLEAERRRQRRRLDHDRARHQLQSCVREIAEATEIEVHTGRLWFRYDGRHATDVSLPEPSADR